MEIPRSNVLGVVVSGDASDQDDEPQEIVHKLQKAKALMSAQAQANATCNDNESHEIIEAREQRSQIAIIQMAPPAAAQAQQSNTSSTASVLKSSASTAKVTNATKNARSAAGKNLHVI